MNAVPGQLDLKGRGGRAGSGETGQLGPELGHLEHAGRGGAAPYRTPAALSVRSSVNQATRPWVVVVGTDGLRTTGRASQRTLSHLAAPPRPPHQQAGWLTSMKDEGGCCGTAGE